MPYACVASQPGSSKVEGGGGGGGGGGDYAPPAWKVGGAQAPPISDATVLG